MDCFCLHRRAKKEIELVQCILCIDRSNVRRVDLAQALNSFRANGRTMIMGIDRSQWILINCWFTRETKHLKWVDNASTRRNIHHRFRSNDYFASYGVEWGNVGLSVGAMSQSKKINNLWVLAYQFVVVIIGEVEEFLWLRWNFISCFGWPIESMCNVRAICVASSDCEWTNADLSAVSYR